MAPATEKELREAGLNVESRGKFGGAFSSDDDSSDEEMHGAGQGEGDDGLLKFGRRPSTTEAKERSPLDDDDDDVEDLAGKESSDEDEQLEMARRAT